MNNKQKKYPWSKMLPLYQSGCNDTQIAHTMGCTRQHVANVRLLHGIPSKKLRKPVKNQKLLTKLKELHKSGCTDTDIARQLGYSASFVHNQRARLGLPINFKINDNRKRTYDWNHMLPLYNAGCNDPEIARQLGCSLNVVRSRRKEKNLPNVNGIIQRDAQKNDQI